MNAVKLGIGGEHTDFAPPRVAIRPVNVVASGQLGDLVCRYTYDGLGRLITKQNPVIVDRQPGGDPRGGSGGGTTVSLLQAKDYYYDGVRRIQEVISRPLLDNPNGSQGNPSDPNSPVSDIQNDELPMLRGGDPPPEGEDPEPVPPETWLERWIDREYVYGPGYVDEFVCQIDRDGVSTVVGTAEEPTAAAHAHACGEPIGCRRQRHAGLVYNR